MPVILEKAKLLTMDHHFSHFRAIAEACETIRGEAAAPVLFELLRLPGMQGHAVASYGAAQSQMVTGTTDVSLRNRSLRELHLARALYRCGDREGLGQSILRKYADDLNGHYSRHAMGVLTGRP